MVGPIQITTEPAGGLESCGQKIRSFKMPKVTISDSKGIFQEAGSGLIRSTVTERR